MRVHRILRPPYRRRGPARIVLGTGALVPNGGFDGGTFEPWHGHSKSGPLVVTDDGVLNVRSGKLVVGNGVGKTKARASVKVGALVPGASYSLSVDLEIPNAANPGRVRVSADVELSAGDFVDSGDVTATGTFRANFMAGSSQHFVGVILNSDAETGEILVDNVIIEPIAASGFGYDYGLKYGG